jgi:hypothetical protein
MGHFISLSIYVSEGTTIESRSIVLNSFDQIAKIRSRARCSVGDAFDSLSAIAFEIDVGKAAIDGQLHREVQSTHLRR